MGEEVGGCPGAVYGPLFDGLGENEGLVGPTFCVFFMGEVGKTGNLVGFGDVACEGLERGVSTLKGSIEDV